MVFPFSASFERSIKTMITSDNKDEILWYINKTILEDKADNVVVAHMTVSYEGSTGGRGSMFNGVNNGVVSLACKGDKWYVEYKINLRRLFTVMLIMSATMESFALFVQDARWVGIVAFLCLWGFSWVLEIRRHGKFGGLPDSRN